MLPDHEIGSQLLERYGDLLTDHQREVLEEYFYEDLSMNEIADNYGVSKAAISDLVRRTCDVLTNYEEKLHLVATFSRLDTLIERMRSAGVSNEFIDELEKNIRG